jgi:hypothetical protein
MPNADDKLDAITSRLDVIISLLMQSRGSETKSIGEDASFLKSHGMSTPSIAQILGSTERSVAELIRRTRSKKRKK